MKYKSAAQINGTLIDEYVHDIIGHTSFVNNIEKAICTVSRNGMIYSDSYVYMNIELAC